MYKLVIFDLDGTVVDSKYGIMKSAKYALEKMKIKLNEEDELKRFVGPTLWHTF